MKELLFQTSEAVANLNRVEGFNPLSLARTIQDEGQPDQLYLDVKYRKLWFRLCNPEGKIVKKILALKDNMAIVEARVYLERNDPEDSFVASALSQKFRTDDLKFGDKFLEMAETAATGRALSDAGYGIQFADVGEENDPSQVDAGIQVPCQTGKETQQEAAVPYGMESYAPPASGQMPTPFVQNIQQGSPVMVPVQTQAAYPYQQQIPQPEEHLAANRPFSGPMQTADQLDYRQPVAELLSQLTYEQAVAVKIGGKGANAGKTMGQIAIQNPADLEWYRTKYNGPNNLVRAAAQILLETAAA